jgi:hypothetical protein
LKQLNAVGREGCLDGSVYLFIKHCKAGPRRIGIHITPARELIIISYQDKDQNQTYLHRKMK